MFGYYLDLALRSLKRNPILTGLMVLAIGLGVGASMTMITVLHVLTDDPMPGRSGQLYYPHIDPLPRNYETSSYGDPSDNFTWPDAMALLKAHRAERQAAMAGAQLLVRPARTDLRPFDVDGRYTTSDFFAMFGVPFEHGHGWSEADDDARAHVVVLSETLNRKLFGSAESIGKTVQLGDYDFRVIGVTTDWQPEPMFYADAKGKIFGDADQFFLPLSVAVAQKLDTNGSVMVFGGDGFPGNLMTDPSTSWLQFWVQLASPAQAVAYRQFLTDYSAQQIALGRFQRPSADAKLYNLMQWLRHENLVPDDVRLQMWLALGFLLVCILNIMALLLAKFLRRSGEVSVRRALGARRRDIFLQFGIESMMIGVAGGILGLGITQTGLWQVRQRPDDYAQLAQMDTSMLLGTFALAVFASVLAGLLPAWRACRVAPALQLKTL